MESIVCCSAVCTAELLLFSLLKKSYAGHAQILKVETSTSDAVLAHVLSGVGFYLNEYDENEDRWKWAIHLPALKERLMDHRYFWNTYWSMLSNI